MEKFFFVGFFGFGAVKGASSSFVVSSAGNVMGGRVCVGGVLVVLLVCVCVFGLQLVVSYCQA